MQFALDRLWQRQRNGVLTREGYNEIGGVEGALAEHAEEFWAACSAADGDRLRRILLRLVRLAPPGEQAEDTRAVALRSEVGEDDWPLVQDLVAARLAMTGRDPVSGEESVEVVHEALIRAWPRLKAWLDEDREFGLWRQRLQIYLADHVARGAVLSGDLLAEAEAWQATHGAALNSAETALIDASAKAHRAEEEASAKRQRTWLRRLATLSVVLALVAGIAGFSWWSAVQARDRAEEAQAEAIRQRNLLILRNAVGQNFYSVSQYARGLTIGCSEGTVTSNDVSQSAWQVFQSMSRAVAAEVRQFDWHEDQVCQTLLRISDSASVWAANPNRAAANLNHREVARVFAFVRAINKRDEEEIHAALDNFGLIIDLPFPDYQALHADLERLKYESRD